MNYKEFLAAKRAALEPTLVGFSAPELGGYLYPFQRDIVKWALRRGRAAIFADCGLGKTAMQLEWAKHVCKHTRGNVLLLAPLAVSQQTHREGAKFGITVNIARSQSDILPGINITNYEMLDHFNPAAFAGVVLDESSILKNYMGAMRTHIISAFVATEYKLACTATPSPNDHTEIGNHCQFLGVMGFTEMLSQFFINDLEKANGWRLKGHAEESFWEWVSSWAVMLKTPRDLGYDAAGFDLPALNVEIITAEHDYRQEGFLFKPHTLTLEERRAVRRDSIAARLDVLKSRVAEIGDKPILVWCDLNLEAESVTKAIPGAVEVRGPDDPDDKARNLLGFASGEVRVLVTKPKIAGFGMNWQHCNNVIFFGLSDSYERYYQAIRRCWRFGNTKPVNCTIITTDVEKIVIENVLRKEKDMEIMTENMTKYVAGINAADITGQTRAENTYKTDAAKGENWQLMLGDSCERIKEVETGSVGFSIFSPPFADLYTYSNSTRDMGNNVGESQFFSHFDFICKELHRILKPGRICAIHCMNLSRQKFKHGYIGLYDFRGDIIRLFTGNDWIYHSEVCIWKDPVVEMQRTKALGLLHKQIKKDATMSRQGGAEYVVVFRKPDANDDPVTHTNLDLPVALWQQIASPVWFDIDRSDTLQKMSAREDKDEKHICPLQLEVIRRCVRLWSNPGDVVFSPFAGIGSELYVALQEGRHGLGIELKESYWKQAVKNCQAAEISSGQNLDLFGGGGND